MSNRIFKKSAAIVLTASMMVGSTMTAFAAVGTSDGNGTYEGGEMKYPTLSVTLPTIPDKTYDYIADPNGLIAATENAKYAGATFAEDAKGIFFLTDSTKKEYTAKSNAQTLTNENAQDIDVTIKLAQKTAGDTSIEYANSDTFAEDDKTNKLYLAITDDNTDAAKRQTAALSATTVATLTTKVAGVPENYEGKYTEGSGYGYVKKTDGLTDWNECSYIMTGALNENATWGDDLTFPSITVTWSYAEHADYTDKDGYGNWGGSNLYLAASSEAGFSSDTLTVEVSDGGTNYVALSSDQYEVNSDNWVSTTWANMVAALGSEPTGHIFIRITDGTTRYIYENQ